MAYSASSTITEYRVSGRRLWRIVVTELEAGAANEWSVPNLPPTPCLIVGIMATITAGTGAGAATLTPRLGRASGWSTTGQDHVGHQTAAAVHVQDQTRLRISLPNQTLYGVSACSDATADHTIVTELWLLEGWQS